MLFLTTTMKILIQQKTGKKFLVKNLSEDFHTSAGTIKSADLKSDKSTIESNKKEMFFLFDATFPDLWENFQQGTQKIIAKDIGFIIAKTGIGKNSIIVDAGGGIGSLALSLANICKEIIVYEQNPQHMKVLENNVKLCGVKNIKIKNQNIYEGISEKEIDVITLDLPEPWQAVQQAERSLKNGGFLVVYLPNLNQVKQFIDSTKGTVIHVIETIELIERKWMIDNQSMRPEFEMLGHTGFLTFCRRMGE